MNASDDLPDLMNDLEEDGLDEARNVALAEERALLLETEGVGAQHGEDEDATEADALALLEASDEMEIDQKEVAEKDDGKKEAGAVEASIPDGPIANGNEMREEAPDGHDRQHGGDGVGGEPGEPIEDEKDETDEVNLLGEERDEEREENELDDDEAALLLGENGDIGPTDGRDEEMDENELLASDGVGEDELGENGDNYEEEGEPEEADVHAHLDAGEPDEFQEEKKEEVALDDSALLAPNDKIAGEEKEKEKKTGSDAVDDDELLLKENGDNDKKEGSPGVDVHADLDAGEQDELLQEEKKEEAGSDAVDEDGLLLQDNDKAEGAPDKADVHAHLDTGENTALLLGENSDNNKEEEAQVALDGAALLAPNDAIEEDEKEKKEEVVDGRDAQDNDNADGVDEDGRAENGQMRPRKLSEAERQALEAMAELRGMNENRPVEDNEQDEGVEIGSEEGAESDGYREEEEEDEVITLDSDSDAEEDEEEEEGEEDENRQRRAQSESSTSDEYEESSEEEVVTLDDSDVEQEPCSSKQMTENNDEVLEDGPCCSTATPTRAIKRPIEKVQFTIKGLVIDEGFMLPSRGDISKKLMVKVPAFTDKMCTCRPSLGLPLTGIEPFGTGPMLEIHSTTREDFAYTGKVSGMIYFTADEAWPESTARLCLFYYFWSSNTGEWSRSDFVTVVAEKGQQIKLPFVIDTEKKLSMEPCEETLAAIRRIRDQKLSVVALAGAEGALRRSAEATLDFGKAVSRPEPPKKKRKRAAKVSNATPECIDLD